MDEIAVSACESGRPQRIGAISKSGSNESDTISVSGTISESNAISTSNGSSISEFGTTSDETGATSNYETRNTSMCEQARGAGHP